MPVRSILHLSFTKPDFECVTMEYRRTDVWVNSSCISVRTLSYCTLFDCDKVSSTVNIQTGQGPYLCNSFPNHVKIAHWLDKSSMYLCTMSFAWCSFAWPSGFAAGSYILSISFGRNEALAELHIVAAQWCMSPAAPLIIIDAAVRK